MCARARSRFSSLLALASEARFYQIDQAVDVVEEFLSHAEDVVEAFDEIRLSVGGEIFSTSKRTLDLCPFFRRLLRQFTRDGEISAAKFCKLQPIVLDRNPKFFSILLVSALSSFVREFISLAASLTLLPLRFFPFDLRTT